MKTLPLLFALGVSFVAVTKPVIADAPRPNILYFYVDDMGWGSIGPNGQAERKAEGLPYVRTPNLNKLAAAGVNFRRGYACTVCSPSRASQQSGFHQGHAYADRNDPNNARKAMRADDVLMGDVLSAAGYVTGYWGKWGYGGSKDQVNPTIDNVQTLPTSHGYQHVLAELHHVRAHTFFQPTLWSAPAVKGSIGGLELVPNSMARYSNNGKYPQKPALQNHADYPETAYCDDSYAFAALDFVREQGRNYNKSKQPFFGLLAVQIPHAPFDEVATLPEWDFPYVKDRKFSKLADQTRQWAAMVTRIDAHFGNILAALEDPNNDGDTSDSIADNTLVIFQSDNGGPAGKNNEQLDANGGLRGNKGKIYEGGIRVPLVMRWPAMITAESTLKAGTNTDKIVDITDLLPTFCELAGTPAPLGIDGVSIAPTLVGTGHQRQREFIIHEAGKSQSIIRGRHKLVRSRNQRELFDLEDDHAEANDIAVDRPGLVKELETLLLGERVTEPKGFANTYHHWTGANGAVTSDANNWSDYTYANAGITYMTDDGAPQLSWVAGIENTGTKPNTARADSDVEFLAVEVRGNAETGANQTLLIGGGVELTGRNEIRVASNGTLTINNGRATSLRWVDIHAGGTLNGSGKVDSTVYNRGTVVVTGDTLQISGSYNQSSDASLGITFSKKTLSKCQIAGDAVLSGDLSVSVASGFKPETGRSYRVLTASRISGTFDQESVVATDGTRFKVNYSETSVTITAE